MSPKRILFALCLLVCASAAGREARADTVAITSGTYRIASPFIFSPRYVQSSFNLGGGGLTAKGSVNDGPSQPLGSNCQFPCVVGSSFSLNPTYGMVTVTPTASLTLDGQQRSGVFQGSALAFSTGTFIIPADAGTQLTLTSTFDMTGTVAFSEYDFQNFVFTGFNYAAPVFGSGVVTLNLTFDQISQTYSVMDATYQFQPAAVPEPATLVLLGTGLAGVAARYRRRRRRE